MDALFGVTPAFNSDCVKPPCATFSKHCASPLAALMQRSGVDIRNCRHTVEAIITSRKFLHSSRADPQKL
jgi:hypothetical protein